MISEWRKFEEIMKLRHLVSSFAFVLTSLGCVASSSAPPADPGEEPADDRDPTEIAGEALVPVPSKAMFNLIRKKAMKQLSRGQYWGHMRNHLPWFAVPGKSMLRVQNIDDLKVFIDDWTTSLIDVVKNTDIKPGVPTTIDLPARGSRFPRRAHVLWTRNARSGVSDLQVQFVYDRAIGMEGQRIARLAVNLRRGMLFSAYVQSSVQTFSLFGLALPALNNKADKQNRLYARVSRILQVRSAAIVGIGAEPDPAKPWWHWVGGVITAILDVDGGALVSQKKEQILIQEAEATREVAQAIADVAGAQVDRAELGLKVRQAIYLPIYGGLMSGCPDPGHLPDDGLCAGGPGPDGPPPPPPPGPNCDPYHGC